MRLYRIRTDRAGENERGAALVEFALLLPVLAMIVFGALTAGMAYNHKMDLTHAAREGARYGATVPQAQCTPTSNCGGLNWAQLVQSVVAERSFGALTTSQVCVALVSGSASPEPAPVGPTYTTEADGTACYDDGSGDTGKRVQVYVRKTDDKIDAVLFKANITLTSKATAKFES